MRKLTFGFFSIVYVVSFSTFASATNYHNYKKFDTPCLIGNTHRGCAHSRTQHSACCSYDQLCSCTGNVLDCHHRTQR
jgi:hypothetical protein